MTDDEVHREQITAAEELRRYRGFFNDGPVVVFRWVAAEGWPVEYVSPNVIQLFGVEAADFLSRRVPYARTVHPDDLARVAEEVAANTRAGRAGFNQEYRIVRPSGEVRWLFDHTLIVRDAHGVVTHYEGYVLDQTEAMRARHEREDLQRMLQQTQKLESLGVLAGGIAHDFNNLLTVIVGNTELALHNLATEHPAREELVDVLRAAERAAGLTRQMLAYAGCSSLDHRVLDLGGLTQEISELLLASLPKKVRLQLEPMVGLPPVEGDPVQLQQVIMNLVLNAAESYGDRSGVVRLTTRLPTSPEQRALRQEVPTAGMVLLEVCDEGCGMDAATRARMFEPFFTTKAQGRGLGLSAVLGILRGHRGEVQVASAPGQGTMFRVFLPVASAAPSSPAAASPAPTHRAGGRVLIVDDEEAVLRVASRILRNHGCDIVTASDGRSAVEIFRQRADEFDLVLLDLTMPEMSGDEALAAMRRLRPDVCAVLTSGYHDSEVIGRLQRPPAAFLKKPYTVESFGEILQLIHRQADAADPSAG